MNSSFKSWLIASRPHTLPLATAGILTGNIAAYSDGSYTSLILLFSLLTGIGLQVLSNFANDYGDYNHGTDNEDRTGPLRVMQSGLITRKQMKTGLVLCIAFCLFCGVFMLYLALPKTGYPFAFIMLALGIAAIWAAWGYTAAKKPYGYKGWGDLFVFLFFGLAAVIGTFFLQTGIIEKYIFLPAVSIGLFSVAVLNINNIRDIPNDLASGKRTIAVIIGDKKARWYHAALLTIGCLHFFLFGMAVFVQPYQYFFLLPLLLFGINIIKVFKAKSPAEFTICLKQLSVFVLLAVICFGFAVILYNKII